MVKADDNSHWTLDKKVPIAIIVTIALQFAGFVWYAAKQDARLGVLEVERERHEVRIVSLEIVRGTLNDRVIRLEEQGKATYDAVRRIEQKLDIMLPARRTSAEDTGP